MVQGHEQDHQLSSKTLKIEEKGWKVKLIIINPGQSLSLQSHKYRSEHWVVVQGSALVTVDGVDTNVSPGEHIYIPQESKHRIKNIGNEDLVFIEVQCGTYFGEDDIVRIEDDYNRG